MDINYTLSFNVVRKGLSDKKFLSLSYHNRNLQRRKNLRDKSDTMNIKLLSNGKNNDVHPNLWAIKYTNRIKNVFQLAKKARKRKITKDNYVITTIHPSMYTLHTIADMQKDMSKKGRWCCNPRTGKYVLLDDIALQSFGVYH